MSLARVKVLFEDADRRKVKEVSRVFPNNPS
jgi:hypothetical protein